MPSLKLTKSAVDSARPGITGYELRNTILRGFFCKITPSRRKVFMLSNRTPIGERRKPSLGTYGQITAVSNIRSSGPMRRLNVAEAETGSQIVVEVVWKGCSVIKVAAWRMQFAHRLL